ncbi:MAG: zinc ribbon domain-containing protein [Planctomycetota bacterium]|nr:MAG: zinc ribbon domain-containing protein [Planctomycetota bacterium]
MPTYDYRCGSCGHSFELFQSMKDSAKRKCPECGRLALERLIGTGAGVLFKGSGFYQTDYRSESYTKAAQKDANNAPGDNGAAKNGAKTPKQPCGPSCACAGGPTPTTPKTPAG